MSAPSQQVVLDITGMTCGACAARVERCLGKVDGVEASVNYALARATVVHDATTSVDRLIGVVEEAGYGARVRSGDLAPPSDTTPAAGDPTAGMRRRLVLSAALGLPVVVLAMVPALQFDGWPWVSLLLATPVATWGAAPFHRAAWTKLRHGSASMDTLVSLGVLAAYGWSIAVLLLGDAGGAGLHHGHALAGAQAQTGTHLYLETAAGVTVFLLVGRFIETRARRQAGAALAALGELRVRDVAVVRDDPAGSGRREERIPIAALVVGDRFVVRPGEKVATDGVVEAGSSAIDAALLTGESTPAEVGPGDRVTGATINEGGRLVVRATRVGSATALAQITRLVEEAQAGKARIQRLADRVAGVFVPAVVLLAAGSLGFWLGAGASGAAAVGTGMAVLVVACPCALGLATPAALLVGTGRGAQLGLLIKGPEVLESVRRIDTVVLDKTGTLTAGRMTLVDVVVAPGTTVGRVLQVVGSLEAASEHPVARAIGDAARRSGLEILDVEGFGTARGLGVSGRIDGRTVTAGRPRFVAELAPLSPELAGAVEQAEQQGHTTVAAHWDGVVRAVLVVADTLRPDAVAAVAQLRAMGLRPLLLSGDNERAARTVAREVGITEVVAEVLPAEKVDVVRRLQSEGRVVAMVGDGINDAAALAQADLGIAIGSGADVAIEASDLTLLHDDLGAVADAIRLSRRTFTTIRSNLFWAFAYNVAALPLAAAGRLDPMIAGGAMALSSLFVVGNSLRLRRFERRATSQHAPTGNVREVGSRQRRVRCAATP